jgi:hypothetical protein
LDCRERQTISISPRINLEGQRIWYAPAEVLKIKRARHRGASFRSVSSHARLKRVQQRRLFAKNALKLKQDYSSSDGNEAIKSCAGYSESGPRQTLY